MLLEGKNAVIHGGGGTVGGAVARAFAREGANGVPRGPDAREARGGGGRHPRGRRELEVAVVDALDERSVDEHAAAIGRIDISFNLISS